MQKSESAFLPVIMAALRVLISIGKFCERILKDRKYLLIRPQGFFGRMAFYVAGWKRQGEIIQIQDVLGEMATVVQQYLAIFTKNRSIYLKTMKKTSAM